MTIIQDWEVTPPPGRQTHRLRIHYKNLAWEILLTKPHSIWIAVIAQFDEEKYERKTEHNRVISITRDNDDAIEFVKLITIKQSLLEIDKMTL